ncbi:pantoate--beta-alanine ligase [Rhodovibrionaceae bacterium A322]
MAQSVQLSNPITKSPTGITPVVRSVADLRNVVAEWRRAGLTVGLVPTMGSLHAGHLSLVTRGKTDCDRVIATIFVNPKQFDRAADLDGYPRMEEQDRALLTGVGCDLLFAPSVSEIYPQGFAAQVALQSALTGCLEGAHRAGHFDGVTTVVCKLLLMALADSAYFGEKDYQQLLVVEKMVADLNIPTNIIACETVREDDGLALSSRNVHLSADERQLAVQVIRQLRDVAQQVRSTDGPLEGILNAACQALLSAGFDKVDYLELRRAEALDKRITEGAELSRVAGRLLVAAWLGQTRLIDNIAV